ncbi:MAG: tRNA (adenosine(37)-N6)-threonylcarbamoyltransferase complex ATPase subunit type 1 TsaE [Oscillospiraceae bacterium]|nr:tRNA (adenosine(37)-N6)-threonylcarbamoyltransferase complex ATPase subunit type 1 TsaE [Oscillospiraceae bacterium]
MREIFQSGGAADTERIAAALADSLQPGDVIALYGGLGAGKTAFVRGLAAGLGSQDDVSSPTFALVKEYAGRIPLAHFDMYRIAGWADLDSTGYYDYLEQRFVLAIEWSERVEAALPANCLRIYITPGAAPEDRVITIEGGALC